MSFLKKRFDDIVVRKSGYLQLVFTTQLLKMEVSKIKAVDLICFPFLFYFHFLFDLFSIFLFLNLGLGLE